MWMLHKHCKLTSEIEVISSPNPPLLTLLPTLIHSTAIYLPSPPSEKHKSHPSIHVALTPFPQHNQSLVSVIINVIKRS